MLFQENDLFIHIIYKISIGKVSENDVDKDHTKYKYTISLEMCLMFIILL